MPTLLQLEGDDLEVLLSRVRDELGPQARIVQAEKVRTGGLAGFFARERFEIAVEVGDPEPPATGRPAAGAVSLLDLADQVSDRERISTESSSFAAVLAGLAGDVASVRPENAPAAAPPPTPAAPLPPTVSTLDPARTDSPADLHLDAPATETTAAKITATETTATHTTRTDRRSGPGEPAAESAESAGAASPGTGSLSPTPPQAPSGTPFVAFAGLPMTGPATRADDGSTHPGWTQRPSVGPADLPADAVNPRAAVAVVDRSGRQELAALGVPEHLLADVTGTDVFSALLAALRGLPSAPDLPDRPGEVIAIVGDGAAAVKAAREVAETLRLDPKQVALVTPGGCTAGVPARQRLHHAEAVATRRKTWRRRAAVTVVAVDAPLCVAPCGWAQRALAALQPTVTWGVVSLTSKVTDLAAWVRRLGGVDALAVQELDATADPGAVLGLGIPVSRLDARRATAAAWAALLVERLEGA